MDEQHIDQVRESQLNALKGEVARITLLLDEHLTPLAVTAGLERLEDALKGPDEWPMVELRTAQLGNPVFEVIKQAFNEVDSPDRDLWAAELAGSLVVARVIVTEIPPASVVTMERASKLWLAIHQVITARDRLWHLQRRTDLSLGQGLPTLGPYESAFFDTLSQAVDELPNDDQVFPVLVGAVANRVATDLLGQCKLERSSRKAVDGELAVGFTGAQIIASIPVDAFLSDPLILHYNAKFSPPLRDMKLPLHSGGLFRSLHESFREGDPSTLDPEFIRRWRDGAPPG